MVMAVSWERNITLVEGELTRVDLQRENANKNALLIEPPFDRSQTPKKKSPLEILP